MIYGADLSNDTQGIIDSLNLTFRRINTVQVRVNVTPIIIIMSVIYSLIVESQKKKLGSISL